MLYHSALHNLTHFCFSFQGCGAYLTISGKHFKTSKNNIYNVLSKEIVLPVMISFFYSVFIIIWRRWIEIIKFLL